MKLGFCPGAALSHSFAKRFSLGCMVAVSLLGAPVNAFTQAEVQEQINVWKTQISAAKQSGDTEALSYAQGELKNWQSLMKPSASSARSQNSPADFLIPADAGKNAKSTATKGSQGLSAAEKAALAAEEERAAALRAQQEKIAAANAREKKLMEGLLNAVTNGDYNQAKSFVTQGAPVSQEVVQIAIDGGYTGIAYLLMKNGGELSPRVMGNAMIKAVHSGDRTRVQNLLKLGADPNYTAGNGVTPLSVAARNDDLGLVGVLLSAGANRDPNELGQILLKGVQQGNRNKVANLLKMGANANISADGATALKVALDRMDYGMASVLINGGAAADPAMLGQALYSVVQQGDTDKAKLLLKMGANVNYSVSGTTPLALALSNENMGMAALLINSGGQEPSGRFRQRFYDSALEGDMQWVRTLAKLENYASFQNGDGESALHAAAARGQTGAVTTLIGAGLDPNIRTVKSWTPLHHAARFGHKLPLIHLLKAGSDVYAVNSDGYDALKLATLAMRDQNREIDTRGVIEYLRLWMQHHPRQ